MRKIIIPTLFVFTLISTSAFAYPYPSCMKRAEPTTTTEQSIQSKADIQQEGQIEQVADKPADSSAQPVES